MARVDNKRSFAGFSRSLRNKSGFRSRLCDALPCLGGLFLILLTATGATAGGSLTKQEQAVSGVWKLVRSEQTLKAGGTRVNPVYGDNPDGYVIYHRSRNFCLFLTRSQEDTAHPPKPGDGLNSYCGTWSIDPVKSTMYHHTEMDVLPARRNLIRSPHYELNGKQLSLFPPIDDAAVATYRLVFEKIAE